MDGHSWVSWLGEHDLLVERNGLDLRAMVFLHAKNEVDADEGEGHAHQILAIGAARKITEQLTMAYLGGDMELGEDSSPPSRLHLQLACSADPVLLVKPRSTADQAEGMTLCAVNVWLVVGGYIFRLYRRLVNPDHRPNSSDSTRPGEIKQIGEELIKACRIVVSHISLSLLPEGPSQRCMRMLAVCKRGEQC